ncbi:MAG: GWxTD domain-containing protein [bacterium]|nr:GWxTD domain-containing protein [bacterium]
MKRSNKELAIVLVALSLFAGGCASSGIKKPTVFVDQHNSVPADIPSQFPNRYERFIDNKEHKEFEKLLTDEERQVFIDKFWAERDSDPTTLENEYKQEIDERIEDMVNERFFSTSATTGLMFRSNGGFRGDMAHVYLLHGEPNAMDMIEGNSFVPLMLWVYMDQQGRILYAFLFYQRGGAFSLFSQDVYKLNLCGAINEIKIAREINMGSDNQACSSDTEEVFRELQTSSGRGSILDGDIFAWALFNFSQDSSVLQGAALEPPKSASEIAKQSKARVTGEASKLIGTVGTDYILASCEQCNSLIPAELSLGQRFTVSGPWKNFDWTVRGEYLELSLKYRIVLQDRNGGKPIVLEGIALMDVKKSSLDENPGLIIVVDLLNDFADIPWGTYQASVYVKSTMTGKYNAWSEIFIK